MRRELGPPLVPYQHQQVTPPHFCQESSGGGRARKHIFLCRPAPLSAQYALNTLGACYFGPHKNSLRQERGRSLS